MGRLSSVRQARARWSVRARRLREELRRGASRTEVERALASVSVRTEGRTAVLARDARDRREATIFDAEPRADVARVETNVLAETPTAEGRVRLLAAAAAIAPRVEVHAPVTSDGSYPARLLIDVPRRLVRRLGVPAPEPGDRFAPRFTHAFFDDEALAVEAARAGLRFAARRGSWIELERDASASAQAARGFGRELASVLGAEPTVERLRLGEPPERAVTILRARGRRTGRARGVVGRARLRRAIGWVDALHPRGPNCFRRVLIELALDAGAAGETLVFGLDVGETGHVAFADAEDRPFDVTFELPARP